MSPFVEDVLNLIENVYFKLLDLWCYFFGHKFGEWESYLDEPVGASRQCNRCKEYQHDSQRFLAKQKERE